MFRNADGAVLLQTAPFSVRKVWTYRSSWFLPEEHPSAALATN